MLLRFPRCACVFLEAWGAVYAFPLQTKALACLAWGGNAAPAGHVREGRTEQLTSWLASVSVTN